MPEQPRATWTTPMRQAPQWNFINLAAPVERHQALNVECNPAPSEKRHGLPQLGASTECSMPRRVPIFASLFGRLRESRLKSLDRSNLHECLGALSPLEIPHHSLSYLRDRFSQLRLQEFHSRVVSRSSIRLQRKYSGF